MIVALLLLTIFNIFFFNFYTKIKKIFNVFDYPDNNRKKQKNKIPITGGLLIFLNYIILIILDNLYQLNLFIYLDISKINFFVILVFIPLIFYLVGLYDDKYNLRPYLKFLISIILFYVVIKLDNKFLIEQITINSLNIDISISKFSVFLTILCYLLFQHAFNMFDGINLQIGFYTLLFFIFLFLFSKFNIFLIFVLPVLFFLILNFKNVSYMGDGGCYFISYFLSVNCVLLYNHERIFSEEIFLLMMIPGFDMFRLFVVRLFKKKSPFSPDRQHFHHYLTSKFSYLWANFISMSFILIPIVGYILFKNFFLIIFLTTIIYLVTIYLITKKS